MTSEDLIREAQDPATPPGRLAELAQIDRSTWAAIVFNPAAYDGLLQWLGERGDPTVNAALAARASHAASQLPQAPAAAPVPPAAPAAAPEPVAEPAPAVPAEPASEPIAVIPTEPPAADVPAEPASEPTAVIPAEPYAAPTPDPTPEPTFVAPVPEQPVPEQPAPEQPTWQQPAAEQPTWQQTAATAEPTSVFPSQPDYSTAPAQTASFGAVPPNGAAAQPATTEGGGGSGRPIGVVIAMVVVIVALIGGAAFGATKVFGGDDDNDRVTALDDKKTEAPSPTADEPTVPAPTAESAEVPDPTGAPSGEFCSTMKQIQDSSMDLLDSSGSTPDLDAIQKAASDMRDLYSSLADSAPDELKADVAVIANYFDLASNPSADNASKLSDSIADYSKAAQNVGVYYAQNCL